MRFGNSIFRYFNFTLPRSINGQRIKLPVIGGFKVGIHGELFLLDIFNFILPKLDGAVLDVGVNVGQTLAKVKMAKPNQRYYGFEPNPNCFAYLESLVQVNGWNDVTFFPFGLSDQTSILSLHVSSEKPTDSMGSFLPKVRPERNVSRVRHVAVFEFAKIDPLIKERIGLLKIDVEGFELEVVRGIAEAIRRDKPVIVFEMLPIQSLATRHEQTVEILQSFGYRVFLIAKHENRRWAGLQAIDTFICPTEAKQNDYLAVSEDRQDLLAGIAVGSE